MSKIRSIIFGVLAPLLGISTASAQNCMVVRGAFGQVLGWNCTPSHAPYGGVDPAIPLQAGLDPPHFGPDLDQINRENVKDLKVKWVYQMRTTHVVETTPLVVDGVMYFTEPPSNVVAVDAETGREYWRYRRAMARRYWWRRHHHRYYGYYRNY